MVVSTTDRKAQDWKKASQVASLVPARADVGVGAVVLDEAVIDTPVLGIQSMSFSLPRSPIANAE